MMEQYRSIQKSLPKDTILFFRLGDFYEMFFEDAVRASEILNITLTGREGGVMGRVPMCGIPFHAFQGYVRGLLDHNLKVAICEQIGDPKTTKGLLERKVTRIITPATFLDEETKTPAAEYMTAVITHGMTAALAYLELSTGEFCVRPIREDRLLSELSLLSPKEVILPQKLSATQGFSRWIKETLRSSLTVYEDWVFDETQALRQLQETFRLASFRQCAFADEPLCVRACGAILYYLRDHFHCSLEHLRLPQLLDASEFMILDRSTQRSLELLGSLSGRKGATLFGCIDQTLTPMGGRLLSHWLTHPLLALNDIHTRQKAVQAWVDEPGQMNTLRLQLQGIKDIERTLSRLNYGVANARDLLHLDHFLERIPKIQNALSQIQNPFLADIAHRLVAFPELHGRIQRAIVDTPPIGIKEGGIVKGGYDEALDDLRRISQDGRSWILAFERRQAALTGIKSLRVRYSQVFGYTIEVSKSNLHLVPVDYVRRQTLANAERFVVPELIEWDQKIAGAQERMKALEYELFNGIRAQVLEILEPLQQMAQAIGILDGLQSLARVAAHKDWRCPEVVESQELAIQAGRHPVVEGMLPHGQFVANDTLLDLSDHQLIVLTGPNMAGKSTYLRQVALIVLLAQMGSFVPVRSARIGLVDRIFTRIGASDDLAGGESTFMVEMVETAQILRHATQRSLLILDEVGRGTSTFDGVSIAWAICEHLTQGAVRPRTLFATHYHELTQLESQHPSVKNYHITVKETPEGILFLRKVITGASDRSYGIHVARLAGIASSITERASDILKFLEREHTAATHLSWENSTDVSAQTVASMEATLGSFDQQLMRQLLDELRSLSIDQITPLAALNRLAAWKAHLAGC